MQHPEHADGWYDPNLYSGWVLPEHFGASGQVHAEYDSGRWSDSVHGFLSHLDGTNIMKKILVVLAVLILLGVVLLSNPFRPSPLMAHLNHPRAWHRATFGMRFDPQDTIGSVMDCLEEVHKRGGGTCEVQPHSIAPGRHNALYRKYADAGVTVAVTR